jgi:hypothetical protein
MDKAGSFPIAPAGIDATTRFFLQNPQRRAFSWRERPLIFHRPGSPRYDIVSQPRNRHRRVFFRHKHFPVRGVFWGNDEVQIQCVD